MAPVFLAVLAATFVAQINCAASQTTTTGKTVCTPDSSSSKGFCVSSAQISSLCNGPNSNVGPSKDCNASTGKWCCFVDSSATTNAAVQSTMAVVATTAAPATIQAPTVACTTAAVVPSTKTTAAEGPYDVVTVGSSPYVNTIQPDSQSKGMVLDLLEILASPAYANFTYKLRVQPDGAYGVQLSGKWNGMVGSLARMEADIAAADITINSDREAACDFTTPFATVNVVVVVNVHHSPASKYLVMPGTSHETFLKSSKSSRVQMIYSNIVKNNGFVSTMQQGLEKVLQEGYALIGDSTWASSAAKQHPGQLDYTEVLVKHFLGLGVKSGSSIRKRLNIAMSKANEQGIIQELMAKYNIP